MGRDGRLAAMRLGGDARLSDVHFFLLKALGAYREITTKKRREE
jgi:hypothetical protein